MSKYIIKNCPCLKSQISYKDKLWINGCSEFGEVGSRMCCQDITDCVIKQVIEKCKAKKLDIYNPSIGNEHYALANSVLSTQILQLFDIEEINK